MISVDDIVEKMMSPDCDHVDLRGFSLDDDSACTFFLTLMNAAHITSLDLSSEAISRLIAFNAHTHT
jgi:hypothetical protein